MQQQRIQRSCFARVAQLGDQHRRIDLSRLGLEQASVQPRQGARDTGAEAVVALERIDAADSTQIGTFEASQRVRGGPAG